MGDVSSYFMNVHIDYECLPVILVSKLTLNDALNCNAKGAY